jgi:hypothetical protein
LIKATIYDFLMFRPFSDILSFKAVVCPYIPKPLEDAVLELS